MMAALIINIVIVVVIAANVRDILAASECIAFTEASF
jgi:hypothetical protein